MKILIIKISSLGDVIHALPVVNAITENDKMAEVDWVVGDIYADLAREAKSVRKVLPFKRKDWGRGWWKPKTAMDIHSFISEIRDEKYDICIDLQGLLRSGVITLLSGAKITAGFEGAREGSRYMYKKHIKPDKGEKHAVDKLLRSLDLLGIPIPLNPDFSFNISPSTASKAGSILQSAGVAGDYAVFNIGARWRTKRWPAKHWMRLVENFKELTGLQPVFTGVSADYNEIETIVSKGRSSAINLAGKASLLELSSIIRDSKLMVTVDSGPMHIGAALGIPIVAIFGPTSPEKTGPKSSGKAIALTPEKVECAPCFKRDCANDLVCMEHIVPEMVEAEVCNILSE